MYPGLLPAIRRAQATSGLEKKTLTALPNTCLIVISAVALEEVNLRVIYALLQSDWLAQDLELEPRKPGRCAQTYFSFPSPAHFRTCMRISGKIRLARETMVHSHGVTWLEWCNLSQELVAP